MWSPAGESHVGANSKGVLSCGGSFLIVAVCLAQGMSVEPSWGKSMSVRTAKVSRS